MSHDAPCLRRNAGARLIDLAEVDCTGDAAPMRVTALRLECEEHDEGRALTLGRVLRAGFVMPRLQATGL